jgi:hypothetical protein
MAKNTEHAAIMFGIVLLLHTRSAQASVSVASEADMFK